MRYTKLLFILCFFCYSNVINALQIGTFKLLSFQNEPLNAELNLTLSKDEKIESLRPSVAPKADFDAAGLQRLKIHDQINLKLARKGDQVVVKLSTNTPITEGYIDILLQIESDKGRSLSEHVMLLNPSPKEKKVNLVNDKETQSDLVAKKEAQLREIRKSEKKDKKETTSSKIKTTISKSGKTLFQIARENSISGVTTEQIAVAIFQTNSKAFAKNNMNGLMKGRKLNLPDKKYFEKLSHLDARKILRDQNLEWKKINSKKINKVDKIEKKITEKTDKKNLEKEVIEEIKDNLPKKDNLTKKDNLPKRDIAKNDLANSNKQLEKKDDITNNSNTDVIREEKLDTKINDEKVQEFESSIINEDQPIIQEVIIDEPSKSESNPVLIVLLLTLFFVLGVYLVHLSKKRAKLKQQSNQTFDNSHIEDVETKSSKFSPENYSFQPTDSDESPQINEDDIPTTENDLNEMNSSNQVNEENMTSVDAYIYKKNKKNLD